MQARNAVMLVLALVTAAAGCADTDMPQIAEKTGGLEAEEGARLQRRSLTGALSATPTGVTPLGLAEDMAAALDIPAGMVVSAQLTTPGPEAAVVLPQFGTAITPRRGNSLIVLSTGRLGIANALPEPGTDYAPDGPDGDMATLRIALNVPPGANRMTFDFNFLSAESPDFIGSPYNDTFTARVTDASGSRDVASATVNSSFFHDVSATRAAGTLFDTLFADDPTGVDYDFGNYPPTIQVFPDAGITGFRTVTAEVASGGQVTLELQIRDLADGWLDSAVVIDNVRFSSTEKVDPNPNLIDPFRGVVRTNPADLAMLGQAAQRVAADGVTQLLLRVNVPSSGHVQFSLPAGASAATHGSLGAVGSTVRADTVTVATEPALGEMYAFALYTSPTDFNRGVVEDNDARARTVTVNVQFTPVAGAGFQDQVDIVIVRPPVVVVPEIWTAPMAPGATWGGGCMSWKTHSGLYTAPGTVFDATCATYADEPDSSSAGLDANTGFVADAIFEALAEARGQGTAVTQVDVVAQGVGGLLARKFVDWPGYRSHSNFNMGYVHRVIYMNTPHVGTRLADQITVMRDDLMTNLPDQWTVVRSVLANVGIYIDNGIVDDLRTDSAAINSIGNTQVPSHVIAGSGGRGIVRNAAYSILNDAIKVLVTQMENFHPLVRSATSTEKWKLILGSSSKIFCASAGVFEDHDLFVAIDDQLGGLADPNARTTFPVSASFPTHHFGIQTSGPHNARIAALFNAPAGDPAFAPSMPSPAGVPRVNSCPLPTLTSSWRSDTQALPLGGVVITSPVDGTSVLPGSSVTVVAEGRGPFQPEVMMIIGAGRAEVLEAPPFVTQITVPKEANGKVQLFAYGIDADGRMLASQPVVLNVLSPAKLLSMEVLNGDAVLQKPGSTRRLRVLGHYDDKVVRNISSGAVGTVYSTSNPKVATVSADGMVTGVGHGIATITARNGLIFTSISVTVNEAPPPEVHVYLNDYNLFLTGDYSGGHDVAGKVAAAGTISMTDFTVGAGLPADDIANTLVAGGHLALSRGGLWGDTWYGASYSGHSTVTSYRGAVQQGTPVDFDRRAGQLRDLSTRLAGFPVNGTAIRESWGGVTLTGTHEVVNVFDVSSSLFHGAALLSIHAPAGSLVVVNIRGSSATFTGFNTLFSGGIDQKGVLYNFVNATAVDAHAFAFRGTVLAMSADITFNDGLWDGGIYAKSLTGDASGRLSPLDPVILQEPALMSASCSAANPNETRL
jgi:choice-of-anchor A domain-containing protein